MFDVDDRVAVDLRVRCAFVVGGTLLCDCEIDPASSLMRAVQRPRPLHLLLGGRTRLHRLPGAESLKLMEKADSDRMPATRHFDASRWCEHQ